MNIKTKNNNEIEDSIDMLCPLCSSRLTLKFINKNKKILLCENRGCLFPLNQIEMDKFIFNINTDNPNEFILNINKLVEQPISNDNNYEDKIKKERKEELKLESRNSDFSDIMCISYFGERLSEVFFGHPVYAIGAKTAEKLRSAGITVTDVPDEYSSYGLLEILGKGDVPARVVMVRSDSGTDVLSKGIIDIGAELVDIAAYRLTDAGVTLETVEMMEAISSEKMDWIAFTSPIINEMVEQGKSVIMISSEMPELLGMCDRIYVMNEGKILAELDAKEATQETIMGYILRDSQKIA